ncbi:dGTPase [Methylomarinovum caldicuralii]|uniref:DGTPase n=1 Tax=Methylomarinovum caldicuralii TaxID=438856 RepID=A0AAU9BYC7_9GAMM|nr:deoxyguanosinetriphosphate triphosphohydrolase [Methylomarinovum caldicuralii]BCX81295.1 dGTPase [Methylomarinovum caldicuralii]
MAELKRMDWHRLLSTRRLGKASTAPGGQPPRTEFARDYDRLIFSSAFRRLQDKTQVFPLAKSDYVRTRLTHSLEVASVGRSLGMLAAEVIRRREPDLRDTVVPQDVGTLVAAACLAHDIGNPPFGHAGEDAIREWFAAWPGLKTLGAGEREDLLRFEGNAQGFRILTVLQNPGQPGGLQMTCAMLAVMAKYPRASVVDPAQAQGAGGRKFGFFQSEVGLFREVAETVGLPPKPGGGLAWHRHPLAFLLEAADDICYHVIDIEDGFKAGVVDFATLYQLHHPFLEQRHRQRLERLDDPAQRASYCRSVTIDRVIRQAVAVFERRYDEVLTGRFDAPLLDHIDQAAAFAAFKQVAESRVYYARPVVEVKACGFEVIAGLLDAFVHAIEDAAGGSPSSRSRTLLQLMPRPLADPAGLPLYQRLLLATDFIAGMTDSYAVELYQRIRGIALP